MSRQVFSVSEKVCLQELLIKYKLNSAATLNNSVIKKAAWTKLTNEFNSIESNTKRTTTQLKKCFDNLKTRRKMDLTTEKRERMKTGGGPYQPKRPSTPAEEFLDEALVDQTDVELDFVVDSDFMIEASGGSNLEPSVEIETPTNIGKENIDQNVTINTITGQIQGPHSNVDPIRDPSRASDYSGLTLRGSRNIRTEVIKEEFNMRQNNYAMALTREEEIHRLKVQQHTWLLKAAEEEFKKKK